MKRLLAILLRYARQHPLVSRPVQRPIGGTTADMKRLRDALERQIAADERRGRHG